MRYSHDRMIDDLIRRLIAAGWAYRHGAKHGRLYPPGSFRPITVPGTPSDRRSYRNFRADVRRLGSGTVV